MGQFSAGVDKYHKRTIVPLRVVDAIPGPHINFQFGNALPQTAMVARVSLGKPLDSRLNSSAASEILEAVFEFIVLLGRKDSSHEQDLVRKGV